MKNKVKRKRKKSIQKKLTTNRKLANLKKKKTLDRRTTAYKKILENGGKSISRAMREAGYSKAYSKNPSHFRKTKKWKHIMEEFLPDVEVAEVHRSLLKAHRLEHCVFPKDMKDDVIILLLAEVGCVVRKLQLSEMQTHVWFWAPDNLAKKYAVEMAYKLKGRFAPEKFEITKRPLENLSNEELASYIQAMKNFLLKK